MEIFPTIVTVARTMEVISPGMMGTHSGSLQLVCWKFVLFIFLLIFMLVFLHFDLVFVFMQIFCSF